MKTILVLVQRLNETPIPTRKTPGSAGFDICAARTVTIPAFGFATVGTGLALQLPAGVEAQVRPRSGLAARHGIGVLNSPGTIDSDYRGEIKVVLFNHSGKPYRVRRGDRIAQLVFVRTAAVRLKEASRLSETKRGKRGFGHTGRN